MGGTYYCECECGKAWMSVAGYDLKEYLGMVKCTTCGARPGEGLTVMVARDRTVSKRYDALTGRLVHTVSWEHDCHEYDEAERLWSSEGSE